MTEIRYRIVRQAPSVKSLLRIPGVDKDKAEEIRRIIKADHIELRAKLGEYPKTAAWDRACFTEPGTHTLRAYMLNELLETHGVETLCKGETYIAEYLNMGDPYANTLVYFFRSGRWYVKSWGDIAERL